MAAVVAPQADGFGKSSAPSSSDRPAPYPPPPLLSHTQLAGPKGKGKGKSKGKNKGKSKDEPTLREKTDDGKEICYRYSKKEGCSGRCKRAHCCRVCLGRHPAFECNKRE